MKLFLIPALAVAFVATAQPADAQPRGPVRGPTYEQGHNGWQNISARKFQLERRIDQGQRSRHLTSREASGLRQQLERLVRLERQYQRGGFSRAERHELDRRYDRLAAQIQFERADNKARPTHRR